MGHLQTYIIVSGGQTGVDRAALDFALKHKISCDGWCPRGRKAEDGPIPARYPIRETTSATYKSRTRQNILDSDATLILTSQRMDTGTRLTLRLCKELKKPVLVQNLHDHLATGSILQWLRRHRIQRLHIAGPRESNVPGIYYDTLRLLKGIHAPAKDFRDGD